MEPESHFLTKDEMLVLRELHLCTSDKKLAYRIHCILLLNDGFTAEEISKLLFISLSSIRRYKELFDKEGVDAFANYNYKTYQGKLSPSQIDELKKDLTKLTFKSSKAIVNLIQSKFGIKYTANGLVPLLHKLGFTYKKVKQMPSKADKEKQEAFVALYTTIKETKDPEDQIYFLDAVHPSHNTRPHYAWIMKGKEKRIKANTGRKRMNINGAYNPESQEIIYREDDKINAQSTLKLIQMIEEKHKEEDGLIYLIHDNAKYYYNEMIRNYTANTRVIMIPLPTYSPNLNLIERLWKLLRKEAIDSHYYERFKEFQWAIRKFLSYDVYEMREKLKSLMTENFQIIDPT